MEDTYCSLLQKGDFEQDILKFSFNKFIVCLSSFVFKSICFHVYHPSTPLVPGHLGSVGTSVNLQTQKSSRRNQGSITDTLPKQ